MVIDRRDRDVKVALLHDFSRKIGQNQKRVGELNNASGPKSIFAKFEICRFCFGFFALRQMRFFYAGALGNTPYHPHYHYHYHCCHLN